MLDLMKWISFYITILKNYFKIETLTYVLRYSSTNIIKNLGTIFFTLIGLVVVSIIIVIFRAIFGKVNL